MKRLALSLLLLASLPAFALDKPAAPAAAGVQKYTIDNGHTVITFGWNHFGFSNPTARLEKIDGNILLDAADLTKSSVTVTLPLDGLHTGVEKLDAHLKTDEFLDATKYPTITFKSTKVEKAGADGLKITGDLSVHGVTKSIVLNAKVNKIADNPMMKVPSAGFDADVVLKRSDFGVIKYVPAVSDEIPVHITLDSHLAK
ncbi:MAG: YceI family protein [Gammaproteobacteria bacterium]|nr:MAG: YceI family protein [Gammaproteobacteria bacterium]